MQSWQFEASFELSVTQQNHSLRLFCKTCREQHMVMKFACCSNRFPLIKGAPCSGSRHLSTKKAITALHAREPMRRDSTTASAAATSRFRGRFGNINAEDVEVMGRCSWRHLPHISIDGQWSCNQVLISDLQCHRHCLLWTLYAVKWSQLLASIYHLQVPPHIGIRHAVLPCIIYIFW